MALIPLLDQLTIPLVTGCLWAIATWGWPVVVVVLMPLFFPLYLVKFSIHGVPFTLVEWFMYVTFFVHILKKFYLSRKHHEDFFHLRIPRIWMPVTLLIFAVLISVFAVPTDIDRREVFGILKGWFVTPILYFYLIIYVLPGSKSVRRCLEWYTISAVLLSIWGIIQYVSHATITPDGRVSGPFSSANYLALYIMPAIIFVALRLWHIYFVPKEYTGAVGLFMKVFHAEEKISYPAVIRYVLAGIMISVALYLTRSFGAFLGLFVGLVSYAIYHWFFSYWKMDRRTAIVRVALFAIVITFVTGIFFATGDPGKFKQMFNLKGQSSSSVRLEVWTVAEKLIEEHPFLGVGPGRFEDEYVTRATQILGHTPYEKQMLHPHNIFLMFWLSSGIIGLMAFLWLIFMLFQIVFSIDEHDGRKRIAIICATMLLAILVHGLVDTPIWKNDLALQFWMLAGIISRLKYRA